MQCVASFLGWLEEIESCKNSYQFAGKRTFAKSRNKHAGKETSRKPRKCQRNVYKDMFTLQLTGFGSDLRQAKLKLIKEGKYAHPYFWSPFILIGK